MAEAYSRQSALAHLGLKARQAPAPGDALIGLGEVSPSGQWALRGDSDDKAFLASFRQYFGFDLPLEANTSRRFQAMTAFWLGPSEWLLIRDAGGTDAALPISEDIQFDGGLSVVTDLSDSRTVIRLTGPRARRVLAKGCALDFDAGWFRPGACASTTLALCHVLIHLHSHATETATADTATEEVFDIYVHRSCAASAWHWLCDAAAEFGYVVV